MGIDRYSRDDDGFRKYVELVENMPAAKRQTFLDSARAENATFVEAIEKYIMTFDRITRLPDMEIAEVLGCEKLKPESIATAIASVVDEGIKQKLVTSIPRKISPQILMILKENPQPKPYDTGAARLQLIQAARELEKMGKLKSLLIPRFGDGFFRKKAA